MKTLYFLLLIFFSKISFSQTSQLMNWGNSFSPAWSSTDKSGTAANINSSGVNLAVAMTSTGGVGTFNGVYPRVNGSGDIIVYNSTSAIEIDMDFNSNTEVMTATFTFSQPISGLKMGISDIDKSSPISNTYFDSVTIQGLFGASTVLPTISKVNPSNWTLVSGNHAFANTTSGQGGDAASTSNTTASQECTVLIDFGKKAINSFTITFANATSAIADPLLQSIALGNMTFYKTINLSGTVWNDVNGSAAGGFTSIQNGAETGTNAGGALYANLVNTIGSLVVASVPVNADGTYSFAGVVQNNNQTIQLSTIAGVSGSSAPASGLPAGWVATSPLSQSFNSGTSGNNISSKDFGIERPPVTPDQFYDIAQPAYNSFQVLNGSGDPSDPGPLAASDPDDGVYGTGSTFNIINVLGLNGNKLFYNSIEITGPQLITNYNPSLLQVQYTGASSTDLSFTFGTTDAAGKESNLATYYINWGNILPLRSLSLNASLQGNQVALKWKTENEIDTKFFYVERSIDGRVFQPVGQTAAAGTFSGIKNYSFINDITAIAASEIIYYRIRLVDMNGKIRYSNTVAVRLSNTSNIKLWPTPFADNINISLFSTANMDAIINITDASGNNVSVKKHVIVKGNNQLNISNLYLLPAGIYFVKLNTGDKILFTQQIVKQ
ncbi:MAG: T9SS type A sorting domain-containing protein [Ferruginibacter sp.]